LSHSAHGAVVEIIAVVWSLSEFIALLALNPMAKIVSAAFFILSLEIVPQAVTAQGTVYLSNLGETGTGAVVGGGGQSFETGGASNGYMLNSITLLMGEFLPNASNFNVSIHTDNSGQAGASIGVLDGNIDPETAGQYVYTASGITLNATTTYWVVATCDSSSTLPPILPPGGYTWQFTSSPAYTFADGWNIDTSLSESLPGSYQMLQFSIDATPLPEPSTLAVLALGCIYFISRRAR
jgi:hypothetical protein